jgi:hypothetical protein
MFNKNSQLDYIALVKHFSYLLPVFIVYKYTPEGAVKKARPVINLWPLNNIVESDVYLLPLQNNILAALAFTN